MSHARRRGRGRFGRFRKRGKPTINHYESTITTTAGGTEQGNTCITGVDDISNRSSHIPDGATLVSVSVRCRGIQLNTGEHIAMLYRAPGGLGIGTPLASYDSTTDPLPEDSILIRKYKMSGPFRRQLVANALIPLSIQLKWKGRMKMRDGDDIILQTNFPVTNQTMNASITFVYYNA